MNTHLVLAAVLAWCAGAYAANSVGAGPVYVIVSPMVLVRAAGVVAAAAAIPTPRSARQICCNLGQRKSAREVSAYSVFNKGYARVPGSLSTGQIDVRHAAHRLRVAGWV